MVAFQNLAIFCERLAIEGEDLVGRVIGFVTDDEQFEMEVAEAEAEIGGGAVAVVVVVWRGDGARIKGQADIGGCGLAIGMDGEIKSVLGFAVGVLREGGWGGRFDGRSELLFRSAGLRA